MRKRFKLGFLFVFTLMTSLFLVACVEPSPELRDAIKELSIQTILGENTSSNAVTEDLNLITSLGEVVIVWDSDKPEIITNEGLVTRPENNESVRLAATLTYNAETTIKRFTVTVLKTLGDATITFDTDGGTTIDPIDVPIGTPATMPEAPTKDGFAFLGWYIDDVKYDESAIIETDLTLTAKWREAFNPEDLTTVMAYHEGPSGGFGDLEDENKARLINLSPNLFNVSGNIVGEYNQQIGINSDGTIRIYAIRDTGLGNILTVKSVEGLTITNVRFVFNISDPISANITLGDSLETLTEFSEEEISFDNLFIDTFSIENTHLGGDKNIQIHIKELHITYAGEPVDPVEFYNVEFNYDDELTDPLTISVEDTLTVKEPETPSREGYRFLGWFKEDAETAFDFNTYIREDLILTARWENLEDVSPTLPFTENFLDFDLGSSYSQGTYTDHQGVVWSYADARDNAGYSIGEGGILLRKASESFLSLTLISEGGYLSFDYRKAYTGSNDRQLEVLVNGVNVGTTEVFGGESGEQDDIYFFEVEVLEQGEVTITIKNVGTTTTGRQTVIGNVSWQLEPTPEEFTVQFDSDGGNIIAPQAVTDGSTATEPEAPTRTNYDFIGWYLEDDTEAFDFATPITSNITLIAKWEAVEVPLNEYTVTFDTDGGTLVESVTVFENETVERPLEDPTKEDSIFLGWFLNEEEFDFNTTITSDLLLVAKWEEISELTPVTFIETFDNIGLSGNSYGSGNHIGENEQFWSYTDSRGDLELDGKALLLREGSLKTTFNDGLSRLSFEYDRAFTGTKARSFEIYINDVLIDTVIVNAASNEHKTYEIGNLDFVDIVNLEIKGIGAQKMIDNVSWTTNPSAPLTDQEKLDLAKDALELGFAENDTADSVTNDLTLIAEGLEGVNVSWASSDASIDELGVVTQPEEDTLVILTATLTIGELTATKEFEVTVKAFEEVSTATVTYDTDGGSPVESEIVSIDDTALEPVQPVKDGYTFLGWFKDEVEFDFTTPITEDITLLAKWELTYYTIEEIQALEVGAKITVIGTVTRFDEYNTQYSNYDEVWISDSTGEIMIFRISLPPTLKVGDKYIIFGFLGEYNSVKQISQGAEFEFIEPTDQEKLDLATASLELVFAEYDSSDSVTSDLTLLTEGLEGVNISWVSSDASIDEHGVVTQPEEDTIVRLTATLTIGELTATKEFDVTVKAFEEIVELTVTFDSDGGTPVDPAIVVQGRTLEKPQDPEKEGFNFIGWFLDGESFDFSLAIEADFTLIAMWEELTPTAPFVETFDTFGLTSSYRDGEFTDENGLTWSYGHSRDEEKFPIDGSGFMLRRASDSYLELSLISSGGYLSFNYRKAFTGNAERELEVLVNGERVALTDKFGADSGEQSEIYFFETEIKQTGLITIKIKNVGATTGNRQTTIDNLSWQLEPTPEEFTVEFDSNGGNIVDSQTILDGQLVNEPIAPEQINFDFIGWYLEDATEAFDFATPITSNITLIAKWEAVEVPLNEYTVTFDTDGGTLVESVTVFENETVERPLEDPTKEDFIFLGWFLNEEEFDFNTTITSDLLLVAKWKAIDYSTPQEIIIASDSSSTQGSEGDFTNMLGLDEEPITVFVNKNSATGLGLYADLRLYGNRTTGNGSEIIISIAEGFIISKVEFDFASSSNNPTGLLNLGNEEIILSTSQMINVVNIYQELRISSLTLKNTGQGTNSNAQIRINSIKVTYELDIPLTEQEKLDLAKKSLELGFTENDTLDSVTNDLTLIAEGLEGVSVSWISSDSSINELGVVTRPEVDTLVTLTATLTIGDLTTTKEFQVTVKALIIVTVTYDSNGGTEVELERIAQGDIAMEPIAPAKEGFTFLGWFKDEIEFDFSTQITEDITLVANWKPIDTTEPGELEEQTREYVFTKSNWETNSNTTNWTSGKNGNGFTDNQGVQVTKGSSGANGTSEYLENIISIEVFYTTNSSKGVGKINTSIDGLELNSFTVTTNGGTTPRSAGVINVDNLSGEINLTVICTTNSVYIHSVVVTYKG